MAKSKSSKSSEKGRSGQSEAARANVATAAGVGVADAPDAAPSSSAGSEPVAQGNQTILPQGQKNALPTAGSGVSSSAQSSTSTVQQEKKHMSATLKFRKTDKSGSSSYSIEGLKSSVYFNKGMFAGEPPASLEITLPEGFAFGEPGAAKTGAIGMTKEQREQALADKKAKLAAMTPAERAALKIEQARKTLEAAEKAAAKLALTPA